MLSGIRDNDKGNGRGAQTLCKRTASTVVLGRSRRSSSAIIAALLLAQSTLSAWGATNPPRIDNLPMYGQPELQRPDLLKRADEEFIRSTTAGFRGDRSLASKVWAQEAEKFLKQGNLDYAMRRYNQAWLLDEKNYLPYWGYGQVKMIRKENHDAIQFYEQANALIDDDYQKPALLTDLGLAYSHKARSVTHDEKTRRGYFQKANQHFSTATALDKKYPIAWQAWAESLYREQQYAEAWEKVGSARTIGVNIDPAFLNVLRRAMPEPIR